MTSDSPQTVSRFLPRQRILLIAVCVIVFLAGTGITLLHHYWRFDQKDIIEILQETVPGTKVTIARFHSTYFIHPGCQAEGLTFLRQAIHPGLPPLVTVQKLTIQANYADLFFRPGHISRILIDGLHIEVPPRGSSAAFETSSMTDSSNSKQTLVEEITAKGAVLEIGRRENPPLKFEIHEIGLRSVGLGQTMSYRIDLQNALPPGEIQATGKFGPWNSHHVGEIAVSGTYKLDRADLGVFSGIQGILASTGRFGGKLNQIAILGETDMRDFSIKARGHSLPVKSHFEATVNGTNGDVRLTKVDVLFQNTPIQVQGSILGKPPAAGKTAQLELVAPRGRVQDILRPFVKAPAPPMSGPINFRAHVRFSSAQHPFLKAVNLRGDFSIANGRFTAPDTQQSVDRLSARARGIKTTSGDPETVDPTLAGSVSLSGGVAKFSEVSLEIPGARAQMTGSFNVLNEKLDFHGTLKTEVEFSDTTHGIKSLLLKPLNPLFKRKHGGAAIPVEMTGTYAQPHFGMEIVPKHSSSGSQPAKSP